MKLLVIFPSPIRGGAEEYALTIAKAGVKKGWQVETAFPKTPETESLIKDFQDQGIIYHPLDIAPVDGKEYKLFREHIPHCLRTLRLLSKVKPDVVHITVPWPYWSFDSIIACSFLNLPTVVSFQLFYRYFYYSKFRLKIYHWCYSRNQKWIAISEDNKKFICQSLQISEEKIPVIYNGAKINAEFLDYSPEKNQQLRHQVRQEIGIYDNDKILLTVGRLHPQKGYRELVQVIFPIVQKFPNVKFVWIGEGDLRNHLVKEINKYKIENQVILLGYRSDVSRFLNAADLFIFPTHFEGGQSFAVSEAMAHGLPIVVSNASGMPEIIENKVHGLLFEKEDKHALLEAIIWALEHPQEMQEMANNAQKRVQDFSEEKMIEKTLALIKEITDNV
ncbi:glycosyltransferase family 4 protein [Aphanothece sacrum]|uniref:Glycosyl transferase n=1 Tax=Aphanothece sacrum FPU1 TaxID=1920663 RepID=A0A401IIZ0_APHSA|nr:glycosyltransferase family 4 protein [Aphanothece sacrum]GBF81258.1 glycosyl transferase [Aphanothece sacrum FPU1]GBF83392.1 glycosyl transferase [Aphanothece sacrum FPU3]